MSNLSALALRSVMILTFLVFAAIFGGSLILSFMGDASAVIDLFGLDIPVTENMIPALWRSLLATLFTLLLLAGLLVTFLAINRLIRLAKVGDLTNLKSAPTLRQMGLGMILVWIGMILTEGVVPWLLFGAFSPDITWEISVIGIETLFLICGCALWVVARLADEAHELKAEMEGVV